ncbi:hypothetical protein [Chondromyces crocatus]|uniref:Uncharacterized protein n=1 Tax=Chondromyces crocatus TaxID=52 RepID=A0A0K1E903_CHOCO|nr:hypothetical protein [Chondromyces crocatus]AKT37361.1 uncharacterized protein CMC5_014960 [Chondromyces crocatus]
MLPRVQPLCLLLGGLVLLSACKKDEPEPQTIPLSAGGSAAPVAADPAPEATANVAADTAATADALAVPPPAETATAPATPVRTGGASIEGCCAALRAIGSSGRPADVKTKANTAAKLCNGLNTRVKSGEVTRSSAMVTIKGTLGPVAAPAECK